MATKKKGMKSARTASWKASNVRAPNKPEWKWDNPTNGKNPRGRSRKSISNMLKYNLETYLI